MKKCENSKNIKFSDRVSKIPSALSIYINEIVYTLRNLGYDITTLSLGEAFFDIPMFDFSKVDFVKGYHYSNSQGLPELRKKSVNFILNNIIAHFLVKKTLL